MPHGSDVEDYNATLAPADREIADLLAIEIERVLPEAAGKVWHRHPVWFLDGNPAVGYNRLRDGLRLMFWSGQSFRSPGLAASGSFQAATATYATMADVDPTALAEWLAEAREIQWDYERIRANRGLVKRTEF